MGRSASKLEQGTEALSWTSAPPPSWGDDINGGLSSSSSSSSSSSPSAADFSTSSCDRRSPSVLGFSVRRRRGRRDVNGQAEDVAEVICLPTVSRTQLKADPDVLDEDMEKLLEDLVYVVCSLTRERPLRLSSFQEKDDEDTEAQDHAAGRCMPPQHLLPNDEERHPNALRRCPGVHSLLDMKEGEGVDLSSSSCWWVCTQKGLVAVTRQELLSEVQRTFKVSVDKVYKHSRHVIEKRAPRLAVRVEIPCASNLRLKSSLLGAVGVQCCVEGPRSFFVSSLVDAVSNPVWNMECLIDVINVQEEELRIVVRQETDRTAAGKRLTNQLFRGIGKVAQTYTAAQTYAQLNLSTKSQVFQKEEEEEEKEDDGDDLLSFTASTTSTLPTPVVAQKMVKSHSSRNLTGSLLTLATAGKMALGKDVAKVGISTDVIGSVTLPLKELTELGTSGFFSLSKRVEDKAGKSKAKKPYKGDLKRRGEVEVRLTMTCRENELAYPGGTLRGLQVLLEKVLRLHFSRQSSEGESDSTRNTSSDQDPVEPQPFDQDSRAQKDPYQEAWSGDLPATLQALVTMYAYVVSARPCDLTLVWLCVCTRMPSWDASRTSWSAEETTSIQSSDGDDDDDDDDWSSKWPDKQFAAMWKPPRSSVMCQSMMSVMNCSMMLLNEFPDKGKVSKDFEKVHLRRPSRNLGENSRVTLMKNGNDFLLTMNNHARARESADSETALGDAKETTDDDLKKAVEDGEVSRINSVAQSRMIYVDASFLGQLFYEIQQHLEKDVFIEEQLKELCSSTVAWWRRTRRQLCRLTSCFPSSAGVVAANQLACILSIYNQLETHPKTRLFLKDDCPLTEVISESARQWWKSVTPCVIKNAKGPAAVLEEVLRVSKEALRFLNDAALFYDPIFSEHLDRSYSEIVYEEVVGKVMENVSSFLITLDLRRTSESAQTEIDSGTGRRRRKKTRRKPQRSGRGVDNEAEMEEKEVEREESDVCHFNIINTNPAWQLYTTLGQLYSLGETLNTLDVTQTPISAYHTLFVPWQKEWLTSLAQHMGELLPYEVTRDTFENFNFENISASASDMEHNLILLRNCLLRLKLPEGSPKAQLLLKVFQKMSDLAILYSDLVCQTLDVWVTRNDKGHVQLTKEVCIGLNNIAYTRRSLSTHMQYLVSTSNNNSENMDNILNQEEAQATGGGEASNMCQNMFLQTVYETTTLTSSNTSPKSCLASSNDNTLDTSRMSSSAFSSASQKAHQLAQEMAQADVRMRKKEEKYVNALANKLRGNLREAVMQSCLQKSSYPLMQVLGPVQNVLTEGVCGENQCDLVKLRLWKILLDLFQDVVRNSSKRGQPEFYHVVHDVVQEFLPSYIENGAISTNDMMSFPEYQSLMQELKTLRRSTSSVIASYYRQRASDRTRIVEAVLDVRMGLTISHQLRIQVAMLSSLRQFSAQGHFENIPPTPHFSPSSSFPCVYIKIQHVPSVFFKKSRSVKTKKISWDKFVVFDESFSINNTPCESDQGLALFSLVVSYGRRSSIVMAEGVVPLDLILISEESSTLPNYRIKLTRPGPIDDYESLRILQQRKEDAVAQRFLAAQLRLRKKPSSNSFHPCCNWCSIM